MTGPAELHFSSTVAGGDWHFPPHRDTAMKTAVSISLALTIAVATAACMTDSRTMEPANAAPMMAGGQNTAVPPASAERPEEPRDKLKRIHMQELDKNLDGFITPDELDSNHVLGMNFATYDTDGDGRINEFEFFDYVDANTVE
ncbi:MAG: hypothetical protein KY442_08580 [Proteobacteria bacterium]|nr:hypothetical protein [Pseudomonadota bacterium]